MPMLRQAQSPLKIAAVPILILLIALTEALHLGNFRVLTLALLVLLLADFALLARGRGRDAFLVAASLAFGLCVIEAAALVWEPRSSLVTTDGWSVRRPEIGWGPQHAGRFHSEKRDPETGATIYSADYTINVNLVREVRTAETGRTIVFFGDSVTFGLGLNDADTLPQQFADLLARKQRVLNLAFNGYGPQQFLRELEIGQFDALIGADPGVVVFVTSPWHAERTACKASWTPNAPRYALVDGRMAHQGPCSTGLRLWLREWLYNSAAFRVFAAPALTKINHDDIDIYIRVLLEAVRLTKERYGAPTLIPFLRVWDPYLAGTGFSNDDIIRRLQDGGALVVDVSLSKEEAEGVPLRIPGDGHPTPLANRLRAALLKTYIEQTMPGVLALQQDDFDPRTQ